MRPHALAAALFLALCGLVGVAGCGSSPAAPASPTSAPAAAPATGPAPVHLSVPSIGADSSLTTVDLDANHELAVPPVDDPGQAAWYDRSERPGDSGGIPAVIVGHINGGGRPGVFAKLATLKAGAQIDVDRADHTTAVFTVREVDTVPKQAFPTGKVYSAQDHPSLRLISCGGDLDRTAHDYLGQVIAYADLTAVRPT